MSRCLAVECFQLNRHALLALFVMSGVAGCRPCETFDDRVCERLGAQDCAVWSEQLGKAGSPSVYEAQRSGSLRNTLEGRPLVERALYGKNGRMCQNALNGFDAVFSGISQSVQSARRSQAAGVPSPSP
jgi:hypothetical protein